MAKHTGPSDDGPKRLPYKKRTGLERERDAEIFLRLSLQGYSYRQIAERQSEETGYEISYGTVKNSIDAQTAIWRKANQQTVNDAIWRCYHQLELVKHEAFIAFEKSKLDYLKEKSVDRSGDRDGYTQTSEERHAQYGDPRFMTIVTRAAQAQAKLFESLTLNPTVNKALLEMARAMGLTIDAD